MPIPVLIPERTWVPGATGGFAVSGIGQTLTTQWIVRGGTSDMVTDPDTAYDVDGLPQWFRPGYRVVISRFDGSHAAEVVDAKLGRYSTELNGKNDSFSFSVGIDNPAIDQINEPYTEWKLFQGRRLLGGGVVVKRRTVDGGNRMEFQCRGYRWYFDHLYVNRMPPTELVVNRSFKQGMDGWRLGFDSRKSTRPPQYALVTDRVFSMDNDDKRALKLHANEHAGHDSFAYQHFGWIVPAEHKDGDTFTLTAWVYVPSDEYLGPAIEDRGLMLEHFSSFNADGTPDDRNNVSVTHAVAPINDDTPKDKWVQMQATIKVPRSKRPTVPGDGHTGKFFYTEDTQYVSFRLYAPYGTAYWDEVSLTYNERLVFNQKEQTHILAEVINLAQDPEYGKADLFINPFFASRSKVRRNRTYLFSNNQTVNQVIDEALSMERGVDIDIYPTANPSADTPRYFRQFYPHKGQYKPKYALVLGRNIASYEVVTDGEKVANSVMVTSDSGNDKAPFTSHRSGQNTYIDGGVVLERVYTATPGSAITSLDDQSLRGLKRYRNKVHTIRVTVVPSRGDEAWWKLLLGDTTDLVIKNHRHDINGVFRILRKDLDPETGNVDIDLVAKEWAYDANA